MCKFFKVLFTDPLAIWYFLLHKVTGRRFVYFFEITLRSHGVEYVYTRTGQCGLIDRREITSARSLRKSLVPPLISAIPKIHLKNGKASITELSYLGWSPTPNTWK